MTTTIDDESAEISFQWAVGDLRALEKNLLNLARSGYHHLIVVLSRLVAYGLTFLVVDLLLPEADTFAVILIAFTGSLSIWVSWAIAVSIIRNMEKLLASDHRKVGWNTVWLDRSGITWSTDTAQEYTSWLGVSEVVENDGSIWIKTGPAHGYYLPARLFQTLTEQVEIVELIQSLRENPSPPRHVATSEAELVKH